MIFHICTSVVNRLGFWLSLSGILFYYFQKKEVKQMWKYDINQLETIRSKKDIVILALPTQAQMFSIDIIGTKVIIILFFSSLNENSKDRFIAVFRMQLVLTAYFLCCIYIIKIIVLHACFYILVSIHM